MAMFHGKGGTITWAGTGTESTEITSWSVDATGDVAESTSMAAVGDWKTYLGGFKGWTASIEANHNAEAFDGLLATDFAGAAADLALLFNGVVGLSGSAILTGVSATLDMNDIGKLTYTFQGTAALAYG